MCEHKIIFVETCVGENVFEASANSDGWFVSLASVQKFFFTEETSGRWSEIKKISYEVEISKLY